MNDFGLVDEDVGGTRVVSLRGEIEAHSAPSLGCRLIGVVEEGSRQVVLDLSEVTIIDSTVIGVLRATLRKCSRLRARLVIVCPAERLLEPLRIGGLVDHSAVFRSREEALGCLAPA